MKENTALIIIDMINKMDFDGSKELLENTEAIVEPLLKLKDHAAQQDIPAIYVNDNYGLWREDIESLFEECKKGNGKKIVKRFIPDKKDFFIIKPKHSGFFGTQLDILLNQLGIKNLILTGIAGDMCVLFTAVDAYMREYNLWVPSDCMASETVEDNNAALRLIRRSTFANINRSTEMEIEEAFEDTGIDSLYKS